MILRIFNYLSGRIAGGNKSYLRMGEIQKTANKPQVV